MKRIAVIGLGRFGFSLALTLAEKGAEVLAIDKDLKKVEEIKDRVALAVAIDAREIEALRAQGVENVDIAVVCIREDFEANLLTAVNLKQLGIKEIIARANTHTQKEILKKIGVEWVVLPDEEMGKRVAQKLLFPSLLDSIPLSPGYSIAQMQCLKEFQGKKLKDLELRKRYGINVVAIKKEGEKKEIINVPTPEYVMEEGDILVVIGPDNSLEKLTRGRG
ncbi:MAG TPA: TrkA family potassium uptake protein [bacterium]|nr:TrkA family potassium uptake protein [bacterium]HEX67957.1 TrkA family potassium uptake protein [bacterium]